MSSTQVAYGVARRCFAVAALVAPVLFGCATPPADPAERAAFEQTNDPLEPTNRKILEANMVLDKVLLRPIAKAYVTVLPDDARDALRRVLDNLKEPVVIINNVLQGRAEGATISAARFAVNSTIGMVGIMDVAAKWGLEKQPADFGQTLYVWGLPGGPYLVLPVFGPTDVRDAIGMGLDAYLDPFNYLATKEHLDGVQIGRYVLDGVDKRARVLDVLDDLQKNSLDFYSQLRSLSQQQRASELRRGPAAAPAPNFYNDPEKPAAAPGAATAAPAPAPTKPPHPKPPPPKPPVPAPVSAPAPAVQPPAPAAPPPGPVASSFNDLDEGPLRGSPRP